MDSVIATTQRAASFLQRGSDISHHGVDTRAYQPALNRQSVRVSLNLPERYTLGVFGRIRPQKGTSDLITALLDVLPKYPNWQVVFVGQVTPEQQAFKDNLVSMLERHGVAERVHFAGFVEDVAEIPRWYQAMDAVACTSRQEGFGLTCLEAMATGVPVVATDAGAWPDIIRHGVDGWIVPTRNPPELAKAIEELFSIGAEQREAMGKKARSKVAQSFAVEHEAERLIKVYDRLFAKYGVTQWRSNMTANFE